VARDLSRYGGIGDRAAETTLIAATRSSQYGFTVSAQHSPSQVVIHDVQQRSVIIWSGNTEFLCVGEPGFALCLKNESCSWDYCATSAAPAVLPSVNTPSLVNVYCPEP
jgi:hypothetical protein